MDEAIVMRKVKPLSQLDGYIVDHLNIRAWYVNRQVEIQILNVTEDVASIVVFNHRKMSAVFETIKGSYDVRMGLQVDPLCDILLFRDLTHDKLLAEIFVIDDISLVTDHMLDLNVTNRYEHKTFFHEIDHSVEYHNK